MQYNIVTSFLVLENFKKSKYFKKNLGFASTMIDNSGERRPNNADQFAYYYNTFYKTTIYASGNIGDIKFYLDHHILDPVVVVYIGEDEYVFDWDNNMLKEKGIDFFLGHILKEADLQAKEKIKEAQIEEEKKKVVTGNADKIMNNPGMVTYDDLKNYLDQKNKNRFV
jgi:hypothetical protein